LEIPINILEIAEMLWKCLELTYDFIFHFLQLWLSSRRRHFRTPPVGSHPDNHEEDEARPSACGFIADRHGFIYKSALAATAMSFI
jgi:hypothetical protein